MMYSGLPWAAAEMVQLLGGLESGRAVNDMREDTA